jgi:hypothetical protein
MSLTLPTTSTSSTKCTSKAHSNPSIDKVLRSLYGAQPREYKILTVANETFSGSGLLSGVRWGTPSKPSGARKLAAAQTGLVPQSAIPHLNIAVTRLSVRGLTVFRQQFARSAVQ